MPIRGYMSCALCHIRIPVTGSESYHAPQWIDRFRASEEPPFIPPSLKMICPLTAVGTVYVEGRDPTNACLSGTGRRETDENAVSADDGVESIEIDLMRSNFGAPDPTQGEAQAWGFPFHESCMELLTLVRPGQAVNVQALFDICRSFPVQAGILNYGHDYGGCARYTIYGDQAGEEPVLAQGYGPEYRARDPFATAAPVLETCLGVTRLRKPRAQRCYPMRRADVFSKLPIEVLHLILEHLPSTAIIPLKQSSKIFANIPLQQSFWKTRFQPGNEFEAIFEAWQRDEALRGLWQTLYRLTKAQSTGRDIQNRIRIWNLAGSLWDLLDTAGAADLRGDEAQFDSIRWVVASRALKPADVTFSSGSRDLFRRTLTVPRESVLVHISVVTLHGKRYVSAIRLDWENGGTLLQGDQHGGSSILGYQHASREVLVTPVPVDIAGFHLAQDERGVRGFAVLSRKGKLSAWAGDHEGIPIRRLVLDPITATIRRVRHLKGGFDVSTPPQFPPYVHLLTSLRP